jgi:phosphoribosylanthranilate isomerase
MFRVKVCGITSVKDACWALQSGAEALGFILYPKSPRYLPPAEVERILARILQEGFAFQAVGVVVYPIPEELPFLGTKLGLSAWQVHGEPPFGTLGRSLGNLPVIRSLRMPWSAGQELPPAEAYHLDSGVVGGTGKSFSWTAVRLLRQRTTRPLVLAGGLRPENVRQALEEARPDAVDVCTGVEDSPGKKDPKKVQTFVAEALAWFAETGKTQRSLGREGEPRA